MNNEKIQPRATGVSFHDVESSHISAEVTDFGNFATVTIHVGRTNVSLFAPNIQEAHAIMGALATYVTQPRSE